MRTLAIPSLVLALAACAAQQPVPSPEPAPQAAQPAEFDPVGTYDFTTDVEGTSVRGVLSIRRGEQGLSATISTDVTGEIAIQRVTMEGRRAELRGSTMEGDLLMRIEFIEDRLTGGWELSSGLSGSLVGTRRPRQ
jgi:hypothetical protein